MRKYTDHDYHPPSEEHPASQEFAPLGDEYNETASDPPRHQKKKRHTMLMQYVAGLAAIVLISSGLVGVSPGAAVVPTPTQESPVIEEPQPSSVPTPAITPEPETPITETPPPSLTLAEAIEQYPDWYDESRNVWLHFEGDEGWFADDEFFHRFIWRVVGDTDGITTMAFNDIGSGYTLSGSATEPAEHPMTLSFTDGAYLLETPSGMGEGNIGSSYEYEAPELTMNSFAPAKETETDTSGVEDVLGKTTAELLTSIGHFTFTERADVPYGAGLQGSLTASMTELYFDPGGTGSLFFDDGTVAHIDWRVGDEYATAVHISYEDVTFSDGMAYMSMNTGEMTLTTEGPRLWFYNSLDNKETCFAPAT